jgi:predicted acyltransferase (DUF342 family)
MFNLEELQNYLKSLGSFFGFFEDRNSRRVSFIQSDVVINGSVSSEGSIYLLGRVCGNIDCKEIFIDNSAVVDGLIFAKEVKTSQRACQPPLKLSLHKNVD